MVPNKKEDINKRIKGIRKAIDEAKKSRKYYCNLCAKEGTIQEVRPHYPGGISTGGPIYICPTHGTLSGEYISEKPPNIKAKKRIECPQCGKEMKYYDKFKDYFCKNCGQFLSQMSPPSPEHKKRYKPREEKKGWKEKLFGSSWKPPSKKSMEKKTRKLAEKYDKLYKEIADTLEKHPEIPPYLKKDINEALELSEKKGGGKDAIKILEQYKKRINDYLEHGEIGLERKERVWKWKPTHSKDWMGLAVLILGIIATITGILGGWFLGLPLIVVGLIFLPWGHMDIKHQAGLILIIVSIILVFVVGPLTYYASPLILGALGVISLVGDKVAERKPFGKSAGPIAQLIKLGLVIGLIGIVMPWFVSWAPVEMDWYLFFILGLVNTGLLYTLWHMSEGKSLEDVKKEFLETEMKHIKQEEDVTQKEIEEKEHKEEEKEKNEESHKESSKSREEKMQEIMRAGSSEERRRLMNIYFPEEGKEGEKS